MVYLTIGIVAVLAALGFVVWRANSRPPQGDSAGVVGLTGTAEETFTTSGTVLVRGELWRATSRKGIIERGDRVLVVRLLEGLTVEVERVAH